jgi:glycosyltransferase involved in cell wall biosynthesis
VLTGVADLTPHFDAASLFVAPIQLGSGTRVKVLEAMAREKAVVATSVAAEGLDVRAGIDLEIADSPAAFADACCRLLGNRGARRRMAVSGRKRVLDRYRWDRLAGIAETALSDRPHERRVPAPCRLDA